MKLIIISALLLISGISLAMEPQIRRETERVRKKIDPTQIIDEIMAHEAACQDMCDTARATFNSLQDIRDATYLEKVRANLISTQFALREKIAANLEKLKNLEDRELSAELAFKCYENLKLIDLQFIEIESRIHDLKGSQAKPNDPKPNTSRPRETINKKEEFEEAQRFEEEERARARMKPAVSLPLPKSLSNKAVYHMRAYQLRQFCCGYNVLFNGCNIESCCGIPNRHSNYGNFRKACFEYTHPRAINTMDGVLPVMMETLAQEFLAMKATCMLIFNKDNEIVPATQERVVIMVPFSTPEAEVDRRLCLERKRLEIEKIRTIKQILDQSTAPCEVVHFICYNTIDKIGHVLMATLVQNPTGRGLFVYDNMNRAITEDTQSERLLTYICQTFAVSPKDQFSAPRIPEVWPSILKYDYV